MAVALETSQLKVEDPRDMLGGVATKELMMGKPPDGAVGVVAGVVDDDGAFAGVEVPGEGTVMLKQPVNPNSSAANMENIAK